MARLEGLNEVLTNMNREVGQIKGRTMAGLFEAGLEIQRDSQGRTPVDTGNLKASAYTRKGRKGVEIGYTAAYAAAVHEMLGKLKGQPRADFGATAEGVGFGGGSGKGTYWESGEPQFLQKAIDAVDVVGIVRRRAQVK